MTAITGKRRVPPAAVVLLGIVLLGSLLAWALRGNLAGILYEPLKTPEMWRLDHPSISIGRLVLDQPSSTAIVFVLALFTVAVGVFFIWTKDGQRSRFWWGYFLVLTGIGAALAGTSYQAFGYELKCRGFEYCLWTSWWEIAYMIFTVAGVGAACVGVSHAVLSENARRRWSICALAGTAAYAAVALTGVALSVRFLLSFELMVLVAAAALAAVSVQCLLAYRESKDRLIIKVAWVGMTLVAVIAVYYVALVSGLADALWDRGTWFTENDVLHVLMLGWVLLIYILLRRDLRDRAD